MFETNSKISDSVMVLLVCGPKKGILNKIAWTVLTVSALAALNVECLVNKFNKSGA